MNAELQDAGGENFSIEPDDLAGEATSSLQETSQSSFSVVKQDVPVALEHALIRTMAMLQQHNLASSEDCSQVAATVRRNWQAGKGSDPIDCLARLRIGDGEMLDASVDMISVKLAQTLPFPPTRVPFAGRLIPPTSLYEKNPDIELLCQLMLVPIVYAEDFDVLGLASINPYFVDALSVSITKYAEAQTGIRPIISNIRLDYVGWVKICKKHFREGVGS